jgi:RHS repeat-associated protein
MIAVKRIIPKLDFVITSKHCTYDKLNRLISGITSLDNYQESGIAYDVMGNITALNRYQAGTEIDQLSYTYSSTNQLQNVVDANASNSGMESGTTSYTYDGNGNMLSATNTVNTAQNKSFTYNLLNLPIVSTIPTGTATYTYDATGNKLRKVDVISGITTAADYINGIQYNTTSGTTSLSFIQTDEGKAVVNGSSYDYTYYLGDNLGNTRITFDTKTGTAVQLQQDDYYPFGLEINRSVTSPKNEYLYNKKELQEEFTEYDYGARFYDPVIVRWNTVDPFAEKFDSWSLYVYVYDNPIRLIDNEGKAPGDPRWYFYKTMGNDAIQATMQIGGYENRFKGLYLIAQRRVENGFNLNPPGNNPMNIKGKGDKGQVTEATTEFVKGNAVKTDQNFANFSTVEKGFQGYLNLLSSNYSQAYSDLSDQNKTITDFANDLKSGGYATDPSYAAKLKTTFDGVKSDFTKMTSAELGDDASCAMQLTKQLFDRNLSSQDRQDIMGQISSLDQDADQKRQDLKDLKKLQ